MLNDDWTVLSQDAVLSVQFGNHSQAAALNTLIEWKMHSVARLLNSSIWPQLAQYLEMYRVLKSAGQI